MEDESARDEKKHAAVASLYQVKLGMPKNKQFHRLNEVPAFRREVDKFDLEMNSDFNKEQRYALKEELFYVIDEKQQQADLTEKGRTLMSPDDPDAFMLPDLPTQFIEIDKQQNTKLSCAGVSLPKTCLVLSVRWFRRGKCVLCLLLM